MSVRIADPVQKLPDSTRPHLCIHGEPLELPHDCVYTDRRNALIPEAEKRAAGSTNLGRAFLREMTKLWAETYGPIPEIQVRLPGATVRDLFAMRPSSSTAIPSRSPLQPLRRRESTESSS